MKKNVIVFVVLLFGVNCYSTEIRIDKEIISFNQQYQQDSKTGYIEHTGRREWIQVTILFEKRVGQNNWRAIRVSDRGEFSQDRRFRSSGNMMDSPILKLNPNNPVAINFNYNYYVETPWGWAYFNL
jgi:hypothetical protein